MGTRFDELPGEAQGSNATSFEQLQGDSASEDANPLAVGATSLAGMLSLVGVPNVLAAQDVIRGKLKPGGDVVGGHQVTAGERFHAARDEYSKRQRALFEENPKSALAGALGTLLVGGNPSDVGKLAFTTAAQAGLSSDELAGGDLGGAVKEAGKGGLIGGLGGLALEGAGAGLGRLARAGPLAKAIGSKLEAVRPEQAAAIGKAAAAELRSGVSALGGESSTLLRLLDRAEEMILSPAASAEQKQAATTFINSPEGQLAKRIMYGNVLEQLPGAVGRVSKAREALEPLKAALDPAAIAKATDEAMASPISKQILPRVTKYAGRMVPAFVAQKLGGGAPGAAAGALVGSALGAPGTAMKNMLGNPSVRALGLNAAKAALVKAPSAAARALEELAPSIARAISGNEDEDDELSRRIRLLLSGSKPP